jgi:hypothetical protein
MGIWALSILVQADTKAVFAVQREGRHPFSPARDRSSIALRTEELERERRRVRGPALGLMLTGIIALGFWGFMAFVPFVGHFTTVEAFAFLCLVAMGIAAGAVLLLGGVCLKNLEAHPLPTVASVLALLPWSPAVFIGLPLGLWSLIVCWRPQARAAFHLLKPPYQPAAPTPIPQSPPPMGPIRRKLRSFLLSMRSLVFASRVDSSPAQAGGPIPTQDYLPRPDAEPPVS